MSNLLPGVTMSTPLAGLYAHLLLEPYHCANLLLPLTRHIRLIARYIDATFAQNTLPLDGVGRVASDVEAILERLITGIERDAHALSPDDRRATEDYRSLLRARAERARQLGNALGQLRGVQRYITQAADALPIDYSHPATLHGLEQVGILDAMTDLAHDYYRQITQLAHRSVLSDMDRDMGPPLSAPSAPSSGHLRVPPSSVRLPIEGRIVITYEPRLFPRQRSNGMKYPTVFVRLPTWYSYLPRFHPNIAHELSHPIVEVARHTELDSARLHQKALAEHSEEIRSLLARSPAEHLTRTFRNLPDLILDESLVDLLALRAAGPAYLASLAVTTIGQREPTPELGIEIPLSVRLGALLDAFRGLYAPSDYTAWTLLLRAVAEHLQIHERILLESPEKSQRAAAKAKLFLLAELSKIVTRFLGTMRELWRLDEPDPAVQEPAPNNLADALASYIETQMELPVFDGLRSPISLPEYRNLLRDPSLRAAPNVIWLTYLQNWDSDQVLSRQLPEGRVFNEWRRLVKERDYPHDADNTRLIDTALRFGDYWEFTFYAVHWQSATGDGFLPQWLSNPEPASNVVRKFAVLGTYDALTVRDHFQIKKRTPNWPPESKRDAFFTHRHIAQQLLSFSIQGHDEYTSPVLGSASGALWAITQVKHADGTRMDAALGAIAWQRRLAAETGACLRGVFRSLGWEDWLLLWSLDSLKAISSLTCGSVSVPALPARTITQLLISAESVPDEWVETDSADDIVLGLAIHGRLHAAGDVPAQVDEIRRRLQKTKAGQRYLTVSPVLGRDDVVCRLQVQSAFELTETLRTLCALKQAGVLAGTSTRVFADSRR